MVSWQTFVTLAFDEAKGQGARFDGIEQGGDFLTQISEVWQGDKERYKQMTEQQTRNDLRSMIEA